MSLDEVAVRHGLREEPQKAHAQEPNPKIVSMHLIKATSCDEDTTQVFVAIPRTICRKLGRWMRRS